jgi:hypothetical protein
MFINTKSNGWGVEDMAEDMIIEFFLVLIDLIEQHSKCLYCPFCLVHHPLGLNLNCHSLLNINIIGAPLPLLKVFNLLSPVLNHEAMYSDPEFDQIDKVTESSLAKQKDIFRRHTMVVNIVDIGLLESNEDVTAQKAEEAIAVTIFDQIEVHHPLSIGPGLGGGQK